MASPPEARVKRKTDDGSGTMVKDISTLKLLGGEPGFESLASRRPVKV
jgi:hypothetical protein